MSALDEVRELAEAVTRRRSLRLWDVEMVGQPGRAVLRVYVDAAGGVDLATIADVSEEISRALDLHDPIQGRYTLEVSSPGLERALKSPEHFSSCVGRRAVIKTKEPLVASGHRLDGELVDAGARGVRIATSEGEIDVPYDSIKSARTIFEWKTTGPVKERTKA